MGTNIIIVDDKCDSTSHIIGDDSWTELKSNVESNTAKITDIENGTVKVAEAINAETAQSAVNADNAQHAVSADTAQNAVNADNAQNATNADNAQHAVSADAAQSATNADNANKLAGMLPGNTVNSIPYIDEQGSVVIGASNNGKTGATANNKLVLKDTDATSAFEQPNGQIDFINSDGTLGEKVVSRIHSLSAGNDGGGDLRFSTTFNNETEAIERMCINANGNIGIGTEPSAWHPDYTAIDLADGGALATIVNNGTRLSSNAYQDSEGTWRYKTSGEGASFISLANGAIYNYAAPAGNADEPIEWVYTYATDYTGRNFIKRTDGTAIAPIFESGSNVNGEYTKFADGTMVCWRVDSYSSLSVSAGNIFIEPNTLFPVNFHSDYPVSKSMSFAAADSTNTQAIPLSFTDTAGLSSWRYVLKNETDSRAVDNLVIRKSAVGRWY